MLNKLWPAVLLLLLVVMGPLGLSGCGAAGVDTGSGDPRNVYFEWWQLGHNGGLDHELYGVPHAIQPINGDYLANIKAEADTEATSADLSPSIPNGAMVKIWVHAGNVNIAHECDAFMLRDAGGHVDTAAINSHLDALNQWILDNEGQVGVGQSGIYGIKFTLQ